MFSSIYAIVWEPQGLVYIGRSKNINARVLKHTTDLKNNAHPNYKLQNAYNTHGIYTKITILETVLEEVANTIEMQWISEFDSVDNGLNLIGGDIYAKINIPEDIKDSIPETDISKYKFTVVAPDNTIHQFNNMQAFIDSREDLKNRGPHTANAMRKMYREDTVKQCHGYRKYKGADTYNPPKVLPYYLIEYQGTKYKVSNLADFCRNHEPFKDSWYLAADGLRAVAAGRYKSYKSHTCVKTA